MNDPFGGLSVNHRIPPALPESKCVLTQSNEMDRTAYTLSLMSAMNPTASFCRSCSWEGRRNRGLPDGGGYRNRSFVTGGVIPIPNQCQTRRVSDGNGSRRDLSGAKLLSLATMTGTRRRNAFHSRFAQP